MRNPYPSRLKRVRGLMGRRDLDTLLVYSDDPWYSGNLRYLTGGDLYTNYSIAIVPLDDEPTLVVEVPNPVHLGRVEQMSAIPYATGGRDLGFHLRRVLPNGGLAGCSVGVVGLTDRYQHIHEIFDELLQKSHVSNVTEDFERLRMKKDDTEIGHVKRAIRIAEQSLDCIRKGARAGTTPRQLMAEAELEAGLAGADLWDKRNVFVSIWDGRTRTPRSSPDPDKKLGTRALLYADVYAQYHGYWAHRTEPVSAAEMDAAHRDASDRATEAVEGLLRSLSPGDPCPAVAAKLDAALSGHSLAVGYGPGQDARGHGIGLDIRDPPQIAASSPHAMCRNMVADVEVEVKLPRGHFSANFVFHMVGGQVILLSRTAV